MNRNIDLGLLVLRLSLAILLILHGISKIMHGVEPIEQMIVDMGLPHFFAYGVYIGEIVAPLLLIAGVATRAAAAIMVVNFIVAISMAHGAHLFSLNEQGGWVVELPALFLAGALALVFTGGGKYALSRKYIWD